MTPAKPDTFWQAICDECGNPSNEEDGYLASTREGAIGHAEERDWKVDGDKLICGLCQEEPGWASREGDGE